MVRSNAFVVGNSSVSDKKFLAMCLLMLKGDGFFTGAEFGAWKEGRSRSKPIKKKIRAVLGNILNNIPNNVVNAEISEIINGDIYYLTRRIWTTLLVNKTVKDFKYKVVKK